MGIYYKGKEMSSAVKADGDTLSVDAAGRLYVAKAPAAYKTYEETKAALVPDLSGDFASRSSVQALSSSLTSDYALKTQLPSVAASGKPGLVGVDYTEDETARNYAVKVSGSDAYVHVPWTGGSAGDVAVDDVTIGKKSESEDYKIYVKSIASLSGDLTATMATRDFVNSSIATNTSFFRGTYATFSDLSVVSAYNNDYAFVSADSAGNLEFKRYKYLSNEISAQGWEYEYTLNNSSFTEEQWQAVNSTIKKETVEKLILSDGVSATSWNANYEKFKNVLNSYTMSAMTQAEYDALGTYDANTLYLTYDDDTLDLDDVDTIFAASGASLISAELLTVNGAGTSSGLAKT